MGDKKNPYDVPQPKMNVITVKSKSACSKDKCRLCTHSVKVGQLVGWCRTDSFTNHRFTVHVKCMARVVELAGVKLSDVEFEETRRRILEVGTVWV